MNNQTSTKNLVIGFALGVIITASLGAALKNNSEVGRFQVSAGEHGFIVDTVTGQAWSTRSVSHAFKQPKADQKRF